VAKQIEVWVDQREKEPFLFPKQLVWCPQPFKRQLVKLTTVRKRLDFGDYCLARHPHCCVIERKKGMDELYSNLFSADRARFQDAWDRFIQGCQRPVLVIEDTLSRSWTPKGSGNATEADVWCSLWTLLLGTPRLVTLWTGRVQSPASRVRLGASLVRLMLSATTQPAIHKEAA